VNELNITNVESREGRTKPRTQIMFHQDENAKGGIKKARGTTGGRRERKREGLRSGHQRAARGQGGNLREQKNGRKVGAGQ